MRGTSEHDGGRMDRGRAPAGADRLIGRAAIATILLYAAALAVLRLALSPYLEIDEAQFVGAVDLRLVYANSHPPLYNWLVRGALELTGWRWALAVALVKWTLLALTDLLVFDAARRLGGAAAGLTALAAAALAPQVSWMSAHTLAHSVLVMVAAAGVVHAVVLIALRPTGLAFVWLGTAAAVGVLAKYSIALLLVPLAVAALSDAAARRLLVRRRALLALAVFVPAAALVLAAAALDGRASIARTVKLYRADAPFAWLDVPGLGVDGLASLAVAVLAWGGVVLGLIALFGRGAALEPTARVVRRLFWRTLVLGLAGFAAFMLAADASVVRERYLTPLMMPLPLLAALHLAAWRGRAALVAAGATVFLAVPVGIAAMVAFDDHRWARPHDATGARIAAAAPDGALTVASPDHALAANITLALRRSGQDARIEGDPTSPPGPVLVRAWRGHGPAPAALAEVPEGLCRHAVLALAERMRNVAAEPWPVTAEIYSAAACAPAAS